jgi:hypothetical protein
MMSPPGPVLLILLLLSAAALAGCISPYHNPEITVTSTDIDKPGVTNIGSVDMYTPQFRISNPSNRTYTDIVVQIEITPLLTYCHPAIKTIEIPSLSPGEKKIEEASIAEFSNIDCQYTYRYDVVSDP